MPPAHELKFRGGGKIGANAFALPGGFVVLTDELVALAETDLEIIAVLMHELGHVEMRHTLRQTLQGALPGLLLAAMTGDVDSLASGLPAALMQLRYSRQMETEADAYALASLRHACVPLFCNGWNRKTACRFPRSSPRTLITRRACNLFSKRNSIAN
jgi:Zn-dependent protease with chaperone function